MPGEVSRKVEQFFANYPKRTYPKGQILIHGGDNPLQIYYLISGKVRQYDITYRGDEVVVNVFKPGAFFPLTWAFTKKPNRYFYDTDSDVETRVAPHKEVLEFLKAEPEVIYDLLGRVYSGLDGVLGRMVHLMSSSAKDRLLYELVIEARRFGKIQPDGSHLITLSEKELAARAGLSRETISREMQKLPKDLTIKITPVGIEIKDIDTIEQNLGQ